MYLMTRVIYTECGAKHRESARRQPCSSSICLLLLRTGMNYCRWKYLCFQSLTPHTGAQSTHPTNKIHKVDTVHILRSICCCCFGIRSHYRDTGSISQRISAFYTPPPRSSASECSLIVVMLWAKPFACHPTSTFPCFFVNKGMSHLPLYRKQIIITCNVPYCLFYSCFVIIFRTLWLLCP